VTDHADIVREGLVYANNADNLYHGPDYSAALAALDALVAERDEAVEMSRQMVAAYELAGEETEAAEAEVARLQSALQEISDYRLDEALELRKSVDVARIGMQGVARAALAREEAP